MQIFRLRHSKLFAPRLNNFELFFNSLRHALARANVVVNFKIRFMIQITPDFIRVAENVNAAPAKIIRGSAPIPPNAFKNVKHMVLAI